MSSTAKGSTARILFIGLLHLVTARQWSSLLHNLDDKDFVTTVRTIHVQTFIHSHTVLLAELNKLVVTDLIVVGSEFLLEFLHVKNSIG
jgi:hypothetical protein